MTYTWQSGVLPPIDGDVSPVEPTDRHRGLLETVADRMIPATARMPAASDVGVAREQLDLVLRSRPDLSRPLVRALDRVERVEIADVTGWLDELRDDDAQAHDALVTIVLAGYYLSDEVKGRLGYPGQEPSPVNIGYPTYVEEGLLDAVIEQGPRYRCGDPGDGR